MSSALWFIGTDDSGTCSGTLRQYVGTNCPLVSILAVTFRSSLAVLSVGPMCRFDFVQREMVRTMAGIERGLLDQTA